MFPQGVISPTRGDQFDICWRNEILQHWQTDQVIKRSLNDLIGRFDSAAGRFGESRWKRGLMVMRYD
jgi:hypothetical protein